MDERLDRTPYRVAQHWRFRCDTPGVSDVLVVTAVEDHPTRGVVCEVHVRYDPPLRYGPHTLIDRVRVWLTAAALDRSVIDLVAARGPLPRSYGSTGEFRFTADTWARRPDVRGEDCSVGEWVRQETERYRRYAAADAARPPTPPPALGLWSLIQFEEFGRLRKLFNQHPSLVDDPLPRGDESDPYCYSGAEYDGCTPLMMAAEWGRVRVAELLLECGADVHKRNPRGWTALHFAGASTGRDDGAAKVARLLCEHGADPDARDADGKTPLLCSYCMTDVAAVLIAAGVQPTLNHALRLRMTDWARAEMRANPDAVRDAVFPDEVISDVTSLITDETERRFGREVRLAAGEESAADEDGWPDWRAAWEALAEAWDDAGESVAPDPTLTRRRAEIAETVFREHRDLLDLALAGHPDPADDLFHALFTAAHSVDTPVAEWLLVSGADPNRRVDRGTATYVPDLARTPAMSALLRRHGAKENPYPREGTAGGPGLFDGGPG